MKAILILVILIQFSIYSQIPLETLAKTNVISWPYQSPRTSIYWQFIDEDDDSEADLWGDSTKGEVALSNSEKEALSFGTGNQFPVLIGKYFFPDGKFLTIFEISEYSNTSGMFRTRYAVYLFSELNELVAVENIEFKWDDRDPYAYEMDPNADYGDIFSTLNLVDDKLIIEYTTWSRKDNKEIEKKKYVFNYDTGMFEE